MTKYNFDAKPLFLQFLLSCFPSLTIAQKASLVISGSIADADTSEELIIVVVHVDSLLIGITTNEYGFYSLEVHAGTHEVKCFYVGYGTVL